MNRSYKAKHFNPNFKLNNRQGFNLAAFHFCRQSVQCAGPPRERGTMETFSTLSKLYHLINCDSLAMSFYLARERGDLKKISFTILNLEIKLPKILCAKTDAAIL